MEKKLKDKMILSSSPTIVKFYDKKNNVLKVPARKCGQKMYLEKDVKKFIKNLKEEIFEDDYLGWRNKKTLKHYSNMIDKLSGFAKRGKQEWRHQPYWKLLLVL